MSVGASLALEWFFFLMPVSGVYALVDDELGNRNEGVEQMLLLVHRLGDRNDPADLFREYESEMPEVYDLLFRRPDIDDVLIWNVGIVAEWWRGSLGCYTFSDEKFASRAEIVRSKLGELERRAQEVGVATSVSEFPLRLPDRALVLQRLKNSENSKFRADAAVKEMMRLRFAYVGGRRQRAEQHADIVAALNVELNAGEYNNIGYLRLAQGRHREAKGMLDAGIAKADAGESTFGLLYYNRGVVRAMDGDRDGALEDFQVAAKWSENQSKRNTIASCLFALRDEGGQVVVEEITEKPDIRELATEGIRY
jgi:tetratricopeptide (TPR) repeat protein